MIDEISLAASIEEISSIIHQNIEASLPQQALSKVEPEAISNPNPADGPEQIADSAAAIASTAADVGVQVEAVTSIPSEDTAPGESRAPIPAHDGESLASSIPEPSTDLQPHDCSITAQTEQRTEVGQASDDTVKESGASAAIDSDPITETSSTLPMTADYANAVSDMVSEQAEAKELEQVEQSRSNKGLDLPDSKTISEESTASRDQPKSPQASSIDSQSLSNHHNHPSSEMLLIDDEELLDQIDKLDKEARVARRTFQQRIQKHQSIQESCEDELQETDDQYEQKLAESAKKEETSKSRRDEELAKAKSEFDEHVQVRW
jgi:hypothetical protein